MWNHPALRPHERRGNSAESARHTDAPTVDHPLHVAALAGLRSQTVTAMALGRHNQPWSDEEIFRMFDMIDQGMSKAEIGEALGRTKFAVTFRISRIKRSSELLERYSSKRRLAELRRRREEQHRALDCMPNPFRGRRAKHNESKKR